MPGTPEALDADREKERLKKQRQRDRLRALQPPPALPSAAPKPLAGTPPAPGAPPGAPGDVATIDVLPWVGQDVAPALGDALALLEEADKLSIETKLQKAHLPPQVVAEVMADAAWPERSKQGITKYGGDALAKGLNALGLSSKHKDVALIAPALAYLLVDRVKLHRRLDDLVKAANATAPPPAAPATKP